LKEAKETKTVVGKTWHHQHQHQPYISSSWEHRTTATV